ncbi:uncharacterized protein KY384_007783 [Bacidia gigantensis]|uniref:uncharacterized protein n=1 Tax=Bacidia gigantensis TaxID=2732470 RepID=UPI001D045E4C|nr:uncharacterized protein KY384_007783 [Bacidia gigantensis]KAG8527630.1 hypothetical protein KY384_007783 [Bacidia gigantensis]
MAYLAPIHRPTSVKYALKLNLLDPDEQCLILAKSNRLEIYSQTDDGLVLYHTRTIYGKIAMLEKLKPASSACDHLFIGTDRNVYFTIFWDAQSKQLQTHKSLVDQADKSSRDSQTLDRCQIDPSKHFMALLLYDGIVTILPLSSKGKKKSGSMDELGEPVQTRISDLFVRSCVWLHSREDDKEQFKLAFLFEDSHQKVCLSVRALDYTAGGSADPGSAELENVLFYDNEIERGASHLIPVPGPVHGALILAETMIYYFSFADDDEEPLSEPLDAAAQFVAWTAVDDYRWLLADDYGKLYLLMLLLEDAEVNGWKLDAIGETSRASVLVYLDGGLVFVGSHQGDSQVVRILPNGGIELIQTISNIGPVLDFSIMDMGSRSAEGQTNEYSSGQARIVTGSGVFKDGSLRSVRSGVGLEEQGVLGEMDHVIELFALRSSPTKAYDDILVASFVNETRIFRFSAEGEIEEQAVFNSLKLSESTLLATMLPNGSTLQVTPSSARLIDNENGMVLSEWSDTRGQPITAASASQDRLILSVGGTEVVTFSLTDDLVCHTRRVFSEGQIACVHVSDFKSDIGFVGFWQGAEIALVNIIDLQTQQKMRISDEGTYVPRSLLLQRLIDSAPPQTFTFLISAASGEVITFSFDSNSLEISQRKVTVLGTQQANLKAIPKTGFAQSLSNVFAMCEHPSLIYGSEGRIVYSAVTAEKATSICPFNSELYPGAIAIATPQDIRIALVDTERTTHVQTLHIGELVRRIAYSPSLKAFGIGSIHRYLEGTQEIVQSRFKLADEVQFKQLDTFDLNKEELVESVIRAEIVEDGDDPVERFIVGTTYMDEEQGDAIRGRILVFAVTTERVLRLITELPVKGACRALGCIDGKIVAALVKTVVVYTLRSSRLQKLCTYRTATAPIDLAIHAPTKQIAVADLMKSISIITYQPPSNSKSGDISPKLTETARHFQTAWSTAVTHVGKDTWLESDAEGNLMVLHQDRNALSADDKRRLRVNSDIRLGEMVNRIRPVNVNTPPTAPVIPKAFMATVEGGVYLFGLIGSAYLDLLISLQEELAELVESLGGVPFNSYRGFKNQVMEKDSPYRFVDGELVEAFLDLSAPQQQQVADKLGDTAESRVWIKSGICTADSVINLLLCTLGYIPGLLHAWYIISLYPESEYEYERIPVNDTEAQQGGVVRPNAHVTYYYVDHRPGAEGLRQEAQGGEGGQRQYGTVPQQLDPAPMRYPSGSQGPSNAEGQEGVPPSYEQAVKGDNKVQT